jgi:hypothetical protein
MEYKRLIEDLLGWGLSQKEIGAKIGLPQGSVSRLHNGVRKPLHLSYPVMMALIELHKKTKRVRKRKHDQAEASGAPGRQSGARQVR